MNEQNDGLIAVMGSTGTVGSEVLRELVRRDVAVRGIVRSVPQRYPVPLRDWPARVSYVQANHGSEAELSRSMAGASALFLLTGTHPGQVETETRTIAAARQAGVSRIVKLSAPLIAAPAHVEVAVWHRQIEDALASSRIDHCVLRPYAFMQNWLRSATPIAQFRTISGSAGDAPRNYVDARDVAAIAARWLISAEPLPTEPLTITGPEALSNRQIAERLSRITGDPIRYVNLTAAAHHRELRTRARLPEWLAQHIVELEQLAVLVPEPTSSSVPAALGRAPRTMDEFLLEHRAAFTRPSVLTTIRNAVFSQA